MKPAFLTVMVAAQQLGVMRQTVYTWLDKGRLTRHEVAGKSFVVNDKLMTDARKTAPKRRRSPTPPPMDPQ